MFIVAFIFSYVAQMWGRYRVFALARHHSRQRLQQKGYLPTYLRIGRRQRQYAPSWPIAGNTVSASSMRIKAARANIAATDMEIWKGIPQINVDGSASQPNDYGKSTIEDRVELQ